MALGAATNFDIDTPDGMRNAVNWTNNLMDHLKEGGRWLVPRSGSVVTVVSHEPKRCTVSGLLPDPTVERVLREAGWSLT